MEQEPLFHEDIYGALGHVCSSLGGLKVVGYMLWPALSPDSAGRKLANCLNPERPENLKPEEVMQVLRAGREKGVHSGMTYLADQCGYEARAIEPEDERARLQRDYIAATKAMADIAKRMERLGPAAGMGVTGVCS
ncbi:hypothetical protein [Parahaliea mediterranea]|uniref:hypothetical protein n=1 Tax=Parahaliea mediterranea TaxID=651086 RepID=UPI000E2FCEA9|nr:hypothetical protein [Parahaliea mediterranea]